MALFISTTTNKIDKKGRISVPAQFRNNLSESLSGIVLFRSLMSPIIEGCDYDRLACISNQLETGFSSQGNLQSAPKSLLASETLTNNKEKMIRTSIETTKINQDLAAMMFAEAQILAFDAEGRISIPSMLLSHAQITDQITFVGRGPTFELWQPEAFLAHHEQMRQRLILAAGHQQGGIHE